MTYLSVVSGDEGRTRRDDDSEHPTELARQALMRAAAVECPRWAAVCHQVAASLPRREPLSPHATP